MDEEELKVARNIKEYLALAIAPKEASKPERKRRKLDPAVEPEKTKPCSLAVKIYAYAFGFLFSYFS